MPLDIARRGTLDVRDPPLKAIVAANDNYEAGYHKGNAGGLDAVDTDLAPGNIKNGVTIFGKDGTVVEGALADDTTGVGYCAITAHNMVVFCKPQSINGTTEQLLSTTTPTFDASSRAVAIGHLNISMSQGEVSKLRLYMGGVMQTETDIPANPEQDYLIMGLRALSGAQAVQLILYNPTGAPHEYQISGTGNGDRIGAAVGVGSIKLA